MPHLQTLFYNLGNLISSYLPPSRENLKKFELLFEQLQTVDLKPDLDIYLNHIHLNPIKQHPQFLQFNDLRFDLPLVCSHYYNFVFNRLSLFHCETVQDVNYLDVCFTFWLLEPKSNDQLEERRVFGFYQLMRLFPNIRRVIFRQPSTDNQLKLDGPLFVCFLNECRALTTLELYSTGLGNADFYQALHASRSLRTLDTLIIIEQPAVFSEHINFSFLESFGYLRKFQTNVATSRVAADLIGRMRIHNNFQFQFYHQLMSQSVHQVTIQKSDGLQYVISVQQGTLGDRSFDQTVFEGVCEGLKAARDLLLGQIRFSPFHWLDDI